MFTEIFIFLCKHNKCLGKIESQTHRIGMIFFMTIILFLFLIIYYSNALCHCILLSFGRRGVWVGTESNSDNKKR